MNSKGEAAIYTPESNTEALAKRIPKETIWSARVLTAQTLLVN